MALTYPYPGAGFGGHDFNPGRANLVARLRGTESALDAVLERLGSCDFDALGDCRAHWNENPCPVAIAAAVLLEDGEP